MEQLRFDGRVAIVTGAGRGLGREYAKLLASRGASLVVNDLGVEMDGTRTSIGPADEVAAEIREAGGQAIANADSVSSEDGANSIVAAALDAFGHIDIVINNAGTMVMESFPDSTLDLYRSQIEVHLNGPALITRAAWPQLCERHGNVVIVSSHGMLGSRPLAAYGSAKAAAFGLMRTVAIEGKRHGVRVNALLPMGATRMASGSGGTIPTAAQQAWVLKNLAPSKVAPVVAYLAHDSCQLTGQAFAAGADRMALVYIGETEGITSEHLSIEEIAERIDEVIATDVTHNFADNDEVMAYRMAQGGSKLDHSLTS